MAPLFPVQTAVFASVSSRVLHTLQEWKTQDFFHVAAAGQRRQRPRTKTSQRKHGPFEAGVIVNQNRVSLFSYSTVLRAHEHRPGSSCLFQPSTTPPQPHPPPLLHFPTRIAATLILTVDHGDGVSEPLDSNCDLSASLTVVHRAVFCGFSRPLFGRWPCLQGPQGPPTTQNCSG
ncbi:hypothetical protein B0T20DRAFT_31943 [Sordaria brevicollis]|uniref:Uncharacterized protein n=1 Tax=Sordaria brevicollis TaxID=83679 RepID=A0AAE0P8P7_SORBR|nr:hypothetical protein B0T20DRAFT_31943 [Sordaria brevicollis]